MIQAESYYEYNLYIIKNAFDSQKSQCVIYGVYGVATVSRIDKLWVSFAEYCLFYRALLLKRPINLSILIT